LNLDEYYSIFKRKRMNMRIGQRVKSVVTGKVGIVSSLNYDGIHTVFIFGYKIVDAEKIYEFEYLQHKEMKLA